MFLDDAFQKTVCIIVGRENLNENEQKGQQVERELLLKVLKAQSWNLSDEKVSFFRGENVIDLCFIRSVKNIKDTTKVVLQ